MGDEHWLPISFSYDADGNRVKTVTNGVTTVYIGSYYEWKTGGESTKYYSFGGQRVAMRKYTGSPTNTSVSWLHSDHLGSASLATDYDGVPLPNSAQRYKPFGEVRVAGSGLPSKYTFTGQRSFMDFGLVDYGGGTRMYSPLLGRFISADTVVPGAGNPQAFNRYSYVLNRPLNMVDPTGHRACSDKAECADQGTTPNGKGKTPNIVGVTREPNMTVARVRLMIEDAERIGYTLSPTLLKHWVGGSGWDVSINPGLSPNDKGLQDGLQAARQQLVDEITKNIRAGKIKEGVSTRHWRSGTIDARDTALSNDGFLALGFIDVNLSAQVRVTKLTNGDYSVQFDSMEASLTDRYDWDGAGRKFDIIPSRGGGIIYDSSMLDVEQTNGGPARPFNVSLGNSWQVNNPTMLSPFTVSSSP